MAHPGQRGDVWNNEIRAHYADPNIGRNISRHIQHYWDDERMIVGLRGSIDQPKAIERKEGLRHNNQPGTHLLIAPHVVRGLKTCLTRT